MSQNSSSYDSSSIQVLEGLEAVRKRPGMYIGSIGKKGLHHLIWEIVDNSIDEAMAGFASEVKIIIGNDGSVSVEDNGRGIPVSKHPKTGLSAVETVLSVLHAGGKFDSTTYKVSGGLHGVGASVVNALSEELEAWVKREGKIHYVKFNNGGKSLKPLEIIGVVDDNSTGTIIKFKPDFTIMENNDFDLSIILDHAKQIAYLNKGILISVTDERVNYFKSFCFEGGIIDYINELNKNRRVLNIAPVYAEGEYPGKDDIPVTVEVALQYAENFQSNIISYANNIITPEGGTHETGFFDGLLRILNNYIITNNLIKTEKEKLTRDDIKEGLTAIISIKHTDPLFEGQTKGKLANKDARKAVNIVFSEIFERYLNENPQEAKEICAKALLSKKGREAAMAAREATRKKSPFDIGALPGKLADCSSKNAEITELYIVEGNSAGGSAKMGRDREIQAILPLRGKVINSEKNQLHKVLANEEIRTLITAIGTGIGEEFNINKIRYQKIIIMTDADVDGAHIRTLLLTFIYRYFRPLIEYGFVYIAQPPLYKISKGRQIWYAYSDTQKEQIINQHLKEQKYVIQRYKGLGEMDPEQLWETTMDPQTRRMLQVQINDISESNNIFSTLMGADVLPRREFIEENAKYVKNIDV
ncbi:DNA topoisomerase (ATP-hydrolyzing) subunit B [Mycoplasma phocimorsus]|uniref:DNA gyrase subunit B n=1 Tax=Mycoplasma phocimorsus TaxID=3045839 RepID=A0AAJ1PSE8_9MOLU|nr:DNA topoisomerase (ATP-hydrolyzing) subunit B [Mycoplasma phocimorsus]MDJ1645878.1 DNA topoisomerase (ATP-hydrolyzing) subunit B [Mycoplasma phocimorsus]MDJ1646397.1 DNA topoisomerase (ATP-hydrolyzing) subunit B [Mycoplasma phocimorsus]MDJ1647044.1 DNA topoisomerase (ATP-hydrolyzing) subunit B [Mycoplasma phocimorsus]MDJ1647485.1 DNA topoisomerase (ATP-hydrolyzing) subunit B [Mycoplasma phocimorsus]MDJ1647976.1 DNA topoisomerase (ATP-hydrolyzing) subunit B [Mycoplasma phocimorsus]